MCDVGDFDSDGRDDIVWFATDSSGIVSVGLSGTTASFQTSPWSWSTGFCTTGMTCGVGDFDGDGRDDIAAFTRNTGTSSDQKRVRVAISARDAFGPTNVWQPALAPSTTSGRWLGRPRAEASHEHRPLVPHGARQTVGSRTQGAA